MLTNATVLIVRSLMSIHVFTVSSIEKNCPANSSYCRGVRAGATKVVKYHEKKCLEEPDECIDLGEAAAQGEDHMKRVHLQLKVDLKFSSQSGVIAI